MGFFDFFRKPDINKGLEEFHSTEDALLLDVRTVEEFAGGHIPGSCNIPLQELNRIKECAVDKAAPLFVYCRSGARSAMAATELKRMGYSAVKNIGGILDYKGITSGK